MKKTKRAKLNEERARVLDFVIESETECKIFLETQLEGDKKRLKKLGKIAKTSPQKVYSCYTKGVQEKLTFLARTTPNTTERRYCMKNSFQI